MQMHTSGGNLFWFADDVNRSDVGNPLRKTSKQLSSNPRLEQEEDTIVRIINYTDYINHEYVFGGQYINYTLLKRNISCYIS